MRALIVLLLSTSVALAAGPAPGSWYVERADGEVLEKHADRAVNPASVAKLATTLWALEQLGADHRFETRFERCGHIDPDSGVLHGDLVVRGGDDPDFHVENAQLVAWELGVRRVSGTLRVDRRFLTGWEGGSEGRLDDPDARARQMAERLLAAWSPTSWSKSQRADLEAFRERRRIDAPFATIEVAGGVGLATDAPCEPVVTHRSNPLAVMLKRFNDYSNNDIERLGASLGSVDELNAWLGDGTRLATLSGLGQNRITPRRAVELMRRLEERLAEDELVPGDVLPQLGCGPSTLKNFPELDQRLPAASLVAKTGTLVETDGGVVTMAGWLRGQGGFDRFFVATPQSGARQSAARQAQAEWILGWSTGPEEADCATEQRSADFDVRVISRKTRQAHEAVAGR